MSGVRAAVDAWTAAIVASDAATAGRLLHADYELRSAGGVGDVDRATWLGGLPRIDTRSLEPLELDIRELGDVAVVAGTWRWEASLPDRDLTGDYAITDVFLLVGAEWQPRWRISTRIAS